jgi:TatA/E family protein of Tat protein translocase
VIGDILQPTHLLFILVVALLVLGPKRLPEVGRALGRGLRDFRKALNTDELRDHMVSTTSAESDPLSFEEPAEQSEAPHQADASATADTAVLAPTPQTAASSEAVVSPHEASAHEPGASAETPESAPAADSVR